MDTSKPETVGIEYLGFNPFESLNQMKNICEKFTQEISDLTFLLAHFESCERTNDGMVKALDYAENVNRKFKTILPKIKSMLVIRNDSDLHEIFEKLVELIREIIMSLKVIEKRLKGTSFIAKFSKPTSMEEVNRYVDIAKYISTSNEVAVFKRKITELNSETRHEAHTPFVFICAPSGAGKTNFAFSLNIPCLYFTYVPIAARASQDIYAPFESQSKELEDTIKYDENLHNMSFNYMGPRKAVMEFVKNSIIEYRTVGFLVTMISILVSNWKKYNGKINSALIQLQINTFTYTLMSLERGRAILSKLFKDIFNENSYLLPIFIDECSTVKPEEEIRFMLLRNLTRALLCNPIFMGTDTQAANFIDQSLGNVSGTEKNLPWCLIWSRLPDLSESFLMKEYDEFYKPFIGYLREKGLHFPSNNLMNFFWKYLKKERPLFFFYMKKALEHIYSHEILFSSDHDAFTRINTPSISLSETIIYWKF